MIRTKYPTLKQKMKYRNISDYDLSIITEVEVGCITNAKYGRTLPFKIKREKIEKELGTINWLNTNVCACGCGTKISKSATWAIGHHNYGKDGWTKDHKQYEHKGYGKNRNHGYPTIERIINAHSKFLTELKIDPTLCWMCQKRKWQQLCHVKAAMNGGSNQPSNIILLCGGCHMMIQGVHDLNPNWTLEKQYEEIKYYRDNPTILNPTAADQLGDLFKLYGVDRIMQELKKFKEGQLENNMKIWRIANND